MEQQNSLTLFVVDDDDFFLEILKDRPSENKALTVSTFSTAEKCLEHIHEGPDVILLDYYLNKEHHEAMNGLQALRQIIALAPGVKVIALSAQDSLKTADDLLAEGAYDYVIKDKDAFKLLEKKILKILRQ